MKMDVGVPLLDACLTGAPSVARRIDAARALGKKSSFVAFKALRTALTKQPFWGIRREVAQVLGAVGTTQAAEALVTALATEKHPKVRRGIVMALGGFRGSTLADTTLRTLFEAGDPSYFVESETLISLGRLAGPDLVSFLEKGLERDSFNDVIRCGAIEGLSHARGRRAYDLLSAHIGGEHSTLVRVAAIAGLGVLGRDDSELRPDVLRTLIRLRSEEGLRLQLATVTALQQVGGSEAIAAIDGMPTDGVDGRVKRRVREARRQVRRTLDHTGAFGQLRDEMDSMRVANRALRSRLDRLEK
jgi:aminopeptidase N